MPDNFKCGSCGSSVGWGAAQQRREHWEFEKILRDNRSELRSRKRADRKRKDKKKKS